MLTGGRKDTHKIPNIAILQGKYKSPQTDSIKELQFYKKSCLMRQQSLPERAWASESDLIKSQLYYSCVKFLNFSEPFLIYKMETIAPTLQGLDKIMYPEQWQVWALKETGSFWNLTQKNEFKPFMLCSENPTNI